VGNLIGGLLFGPKAPKQTAGRLEDLSIQGSDYGAPIPLFYGGRIADGSFGGVPAAGQVIDANPAGGIEEKKSETPTVGTGAAPANQPDVYEYFLSCAILIGEGPLQIDKIWANEKVIYDRYGNDSKARGFSLSRESGTGADMSEGLRLYPGNYTQLPDSWLEQVHAETGGAPAYRGCCYFVLVKHALAPYNNAIPTFRALVQNGITRKREMVVAHVKRAGVPDLHIDICEIHGELRGAFQTQQGGARDFCEKIASTSLCDLAEWDAQIKDVNRVDATEYEIDENDLAAHLENGGGNSSGAGGESNADSQSAIIGIQQDDDIPSQCSLRYLDPDNNHEPSVAIGLGHWTSPAAFGTANNDMSVELPIVATATEMIPLAQTIIDEAVAGRYSIDVSTLPRYIRHTPGNVLNIPTLNGPMRARITNQVLGAPGPIRMECRSYDPGVYNDQRAAVAPGSSTPGSSTPGVTEPTVPKTPNEVPIYDAPTYAFLDLVPLSEQDVNEAAFYFAAGTSSDKAWSGAQLTPNGAPSHFSSQIVPGATPLGASVTSLSVAGVNPGLFDYSTTLRISLERGSVGNATEAQVRAGANLLALGERLIHWTTATEVEAGVFDLTGLLNGVGGSDYYGEDTGTIASGTRVCLLVDNAGKRQTGIIRVPMQRTSINQAMQFQVAATAPALTNLPEEDRPITPLQSVTFAGNSLKPHSPWGIEVSRDEGTGDVTIQWRARTREPNAWYNTGVAPEQADTNKFQLTLKNGSSVAHTRDVTHADAAAPVSVTISAADLSSYGLDPDSLSGEVRHYGRYIALGHPRRFTNL
jgi:Putative phage tail protein